MTMIGIDPAKATHTAVAVGDDEHVIDEFTLRLTAHMAGYALPERRFGSVVLSGLWKGCEVTPTG